MKILKTKDKKWIEYIVFRLPEHNQNNYWRGWGLYLIFARIFLPCMQGDQIGRFSPIGWQFTRGSFCLRTKVAYTFLGHRSPRLSIHITYFWQKTGWSTFLAIFPKHIWDRWYDLKIFFLPINLAKKWRFY
jgi:hypothetical protein